MPMKKDRRIEQDFKALKSITPAELKKRTAREEQGLKEAQREGDAFGIVHQLADLSVPIVLAGQQAILRGDAAGWNGVLEYCWAQIESYARKRVRSTSSAKWAAPPLLLLLAVEGWKPAFKTILAELEDRLSLVRSERKELPLAFFTVYVAKLLAGDKRARLDGPSGPISKLVARWDGELTNKVLVDVCELQLKQRVQFVNFETTPIWYFALERLRRMRGLETPLPEHPLFATPFATLPPKLKFDPKKSALLKRFAKAPKVKD